MGKPTSIILIRHGETEYTRVHRIHGSTDASLTDKGLAAARKTADHFRGQTIDAIYSSPLGRAMKTAKIIGEAIARTPVPEAGLEERGYGWLEGKPMKLFEPDFSGPKIFLPYVKFALKQSGEDSDTFLQRVTTAFDRIANDHSGQRVMLVTHWMPISVIYLHATGQDAQRYRSMGPWTACGICEFKGDPRNWEIIQLNADGHLS